MSIIHDPENNSVIQLDDDLVPRPHWGHAVYRQVVILAVMLYVGMCIYDTHGIPGLVGWIGAAIALYFHKRWLLASMRRRMVEALLRKTGLVVDA